MPAINTKNTRDQKNVNCRKNAGEKKCSKLVSSPGHRFVITIIIISYGRLYG